MNQHERELAWAGGLILVSDDATMIQPRANSKQADTDHHHRALVWNAVFPIETSIATLLTGLLITPDVTRIEGQTSESQRRRDRSGSLQAKLKK